MEWKFRVDTSAVNSLMHSFEHSWWSLHLKSQFGILQYEAGEFTIMFPSSPQAKVGFSAERIECSWAQQSEMLLDVHAWSHMATGEEVLRCSWSCLTRPHAYTRTHYTAATLLKKHCLAVPHAAFPMVNTQIRNPSIRPATEAPGVKWTGICSESKDAVKSTCFSQLGELLPGTTGRTINRPCWAQGIVKQCQECVLPTRDSFSSVVVGCIKSIATV